MTRKTLTHPVPKSRIFFYLCVLVALAGAPALAFQLRSVGVTATVGTRVEAVPGKLLTLSFKVTNNSATKKRFESSVVPPTGWRRLAKEAPFELEAGASDIRLLTISIPAETPAGDYVLRYAVHDPSNPSDAGEVSITIGITAVKEQGLRLLDSPRLVVAGDSYVSLFLLTNKGNVSSAVQVTAQSSNRFPAVPDSALIHLQAGESRTITVKVVTDKALSGKAQDVVELAVQLDPSNVVRANSYVEVIPRVTGVEERFIRFPVIAKVRFAGEQGKNGAQVEVEGSGPLGSDQENRLEILLRTPDIQQKSILAQRDEYKVSYATKQYDLYVGDKSFSLSPLTEFNRYAFGGSGNARIRGFSVGGFYNETRFLSPRQKEWAGYLSYHVLDAAQVGVNYLGKQDLTRSDIVSVRSLVQPSKNSEVDLEYGVGNASNQRDEAYSARWSGRESWVSYDARYVRAGPNYPGYFKDLDLKNFSLNLEPFRDLRVEGYYRDEKRNLDRDTLLQAAPRDRYYQLGLAFQNLFAVYYRSNDQDDLLPIPHYRRTEETWQLRAGFSTPRITFIGNADLGTLRDDLAQNTNPYQRYSVFASFQPFSGHTYGFSAEYTKDRDPSTFQPEKRLAGSVSVNIFVYDATQIALALFGNRTQGPFDQTYSLFDVSVSHTFPFGHLLTVRGRQSIFTPSIEGKELAYAVEYSIPIGVPIARSRISGQLVGRVVDAEKGGGIQNILVYAGGATALTDRNGDYHFPALKPDKYFVQLDMASTGLNRVAIQVLPHEVNIAGGEESRFDIALIRSMSVTGIITMYGAKEQAANDTTQPVLEGLGGHPNVVLELSNAEEVNRRISDNHGRFVFSGIRPGTWTLRIIDGNLPQNYSFDRDSYELSVAPGQTMEVAFKALPRRRRIQFVQQGKTVEAAPQKGKMVETVPQKPKAVEIAPPKQVAVEKPVAKEIRKPSVAPQQIPLQPLQGPCSVVFVEEKLDFAIEHSTWFTRAMADTVAAQMKSKTGLRAIVRKIAPRKAGPRYRVLLGAFWSRQAAEEACASIQNVH